MDLTSRGLNLRPKKAVEAVRRGVKGQLRAIQRKHDAQVLVAGLDDELLLLVELLLGVLHLEIEESPFVFRSIRKKPTEVSLLLSMRITQSSLLQNLQ
jgi:hypothetical protein